MHRALSADAVGAAALPQRQRAAKRRTLGAPHARCLACLAPQDSPWVHSMWQPCLHATYREQFTCVHKQQGKCYQQSFRGSMPAHWPPVSAPHEVSAPSPGYASGRRGCRACREPCVPASKGEETCGPDARCAGADPPRAKSAPARAEPLVTPPRRARLCRGLGGQAGAGAAGAAASPAAQPRGPRSAPAPVPARDRGGGPGGRGPQPARASRLVVDELEARGRGVRRRAAGALRVRAGAGAAVPRALGGAATWAGVLRGAAAPGGAPGAALADGRPERLRLCETAPCPRAAAHAPALEGAPASESGSPRAGWGSCGSSSSGWSSGKGSAGGAGARAQEDAASPPPPATPPRLEPPERPLAGGRELPKSPRKARWAAAGGAAPQAGGAGAALQPSPFEAASFEAALEPPPPPAAMARSPFECATDAPFSPPRAAPGGAFAAEFAAGCGAMEAFGGSASSYGGMLGDAAGRSAAAPARPALGRGQHDFLASLRQADASARQRGWRPAGFRAGPGAAPTAAAAAAAGAPARATPAAPASGLAALGLRPALAAGAAGRRAHGSAALAAGAAALGGSFGAAARLGGLTALWAPGPAAGSRTAAPPALFGSSVVGVQLAGASTGSLHCTVAGNAAAPAGAPGAGARAAPGGLKPGKPSAEELDARRRELRLDVLRRLGAAGGRAGAGSGADSGSLTSTSAGSWAGSWASQGSSQGSSTSMVRISPRRSPPPEPADSFFGDVGVSLAPGAAGGGGGGFMDVDSLLPRAAPAPRAGGAPAGPPAGGDCAGSPPRPPAWALPAAAAPAPPPAPAPAPAAASGAPAGATAREASRGAPAGAQAPDAASAASLAAHRTGPRGHAGALGGRSSHDSQASGAGNFGALERESAAFMESAGLSADALLDELLAGGEGGAWGACGGPLCA